MSGICGWLDRSLSDADEAARTVAAILRPLAGPSAGDSPALTVGNGTVFARTGVVPACTYRAGNIIAAVDGRANWMSPNLAALAARQGHAAALAQAFELHGLDCVREVRGPAAIAVMNAVDGIGLIAVDRLGIRPLCYANPTGLIVFASSAESVAAHPRVGRTVSNQGIFNYLHGHVVPSPGTIFHGVQKLLPGECVTFTNGAINRSFYWQLQYEDESDDRFEVLAEKFVTCLGSAVERTVGEDLSIGAFLSGGTDSSTVVGLVARSKTRRLRTYSIGFAAAGFDEMNYARITANHFATEAHEYYVTPQDIVDTIPLIAQSYDEPFGNDSAVPTYRCARLARADGVQVMLAGDGGDEIFGGNARYAKQLLFEAYASIPAPLRRALIEPLAGNRAGRERIWPLGKLRSYVEQAAVPLPDRLESYNFLHRAPLSEILNADFLAAVDVAQPVAFLREVYQRTRSRSSVNRMMHLDLKHALADNDLRKVSRMCEAAGVEARFPLLDEALVEFSGQIPPGLKIKGLKLRYFFKRALADFLPRETIRKTKHGFGLPFGPWLRSHKPLAELAQASLDSFSRRGIVKPTYIRELLLHHETGHAAYYGTMIWVLMILECWLAGRKL